MKKILVTLGPSSLNEKTIKELTACGVYLFRINLSHTKVEDLPEIISFIKSVSDVDICLDSEGAQIRNQDMEGGVASLVEGDVITIHHDEVLGDSKSISFTPIGVSKQFQSGDIIKVDFDNAALKVLCNDEGKCEAQVLKSGEVGSRKATDINRKVSMPTITEKDKAAIKIGLEMGVRNFALSFAGCRKDVEDMRDLIGPDSRLISKIESRDGLQNLKDILEVTDDILIDRGDLSRDVSIEKIPFLQRRIISMARIFDKPVHVATNLLESMLDRQSPNRAEVNDVVSSLLMGADGLVLAAETAVGKYPVFAVDTIRELIIATRKWTPNTTISEILEM